MRARIFAVVSLAVTTNFAIAQNETDVLRYSQTYMKGTARFTAMGGAFGALGGDISSLMVNPAGVAVYRTSEFVFSTGIYNANLHTEYRGESAFDNRTSVNIGNAGGVLPVFNNGNGAIRNFNIGVAYNRVNDFGMDTYLTGFNAQNSITDYFAANANGIYQNYLTNSKPFDVIINDAPKGYEHLIGGGLPWESVLAWKTYLIDPDNSNANDPDNYLYQSPLHEGDGVFQDQWQKIRGYNDVINLSLGGNVYDLVFFGASLNITNISYHSTKTYSEEAEAKNFNDPTLPRFNKMYYDEVYNANGSGYSLSLGVILKPIQELRIGVSYQSPTWTYIDEDYSGYMNSYFSNVAANESFAEYETPISAFSYRVNSPQKLTGSVAGVIGKFAILSTDVEWVNYNGMRIKGDNYYRNFFNGINSTIENVFRNTINLRVGGEFKLSNLALRAGYQYYQNPYKKDFINADHPTQVFSGGIGYRTRSFFADFAYSLMTQKNSYSLYDYLETDASGNVVRDIYSGTATQDINKNAYILTIGFKF